MCVNISYSVHKSVKQSLFYGRFLECLADHSTNDVFISHRHLSDFFYPPLVSADMN